MVVLVTVGIGNYRADLFHVFTVEDCDFFRLCNHDLGLFCRRRYHFVFD